MGVAEANRKVTSGAPSGRHAGSLPVACLGRCSKEANACAARAPGDPGQIPLYRPEGLNILHTFNTL